MSTHRIIQIGDILDRVQNRAKVLRRCAIQAVEIGNRGACDYWIQQAQKCDSVAMRCYLVLGRDWSKRSKAIA